MNVYLGPWSRTQRRRPRALGWLAFATLLFAAPLATAQSANKLDNIDVATLPGQQIQLTLHTTDLAPQPLAFTIDKPARLSIDLPGVGLALASRRVDVKSAGVDSVVSGEASGRSRVVVNLDAPAPYDVRVNGNTIVVTIGKVPAGATPGAGAQAAPAAAAVAETAPATPAVPVRAVAPPASRRVASVDFRRAADGTGRVIVGLSDPRTPVNLRQEGSSIVVDFVGAQIDTGLVKRYDVVDFATPVTHFDALRVDGSSRLVIAANGDFDQLAYQSNNQYVIEVRKTTGAKSATGDERREYSGERLTLNFQDIDVRAVLQLLADTSGQNIVVSDSVQGSLTLRLQNVPWDQALDIVLRTKGLGMRRRDNVILVGLSDELSNREKAELQAKKDVEELAPLRTEYLQVNYAKAADLQALIRGRAVASTGGSAGLSGGGNNSLL